MDLSFKSVGALFAGGCRGCVYRKLVDDLFRFFPSSIRQDEVSGDDMQEAQAAQAARVHVFGHLFEC